MTIKFDELAGRADRNEYDSMLKSIHDDMWTNKHNSMMIDAPDVLKSYYKTQKFLYDVLNNSIYEYKADDVKPSEIDYSAYAEFSGHYNIDMDISISKFGRHIENCDDPASLNYYNMINTSIRQGRIVQQDVYHVGADGLEPEGSRHMIFNDGRCVSRFCDFEQKIAGQIAADKTAAKLHPELAGVVADRADEHDMEVG
jgi:hypothetical protein